jgi:hypothetical protein
LRLPPFCEWRPTSGPGLGSRHAHCWAPPAHIRTGPILASGLYGAFFVNGYHAIVRSAPRGFIPPTAYFHPLWMIQRRSAELGMKVKIGWHAPRSVKRTASVALYAEIAASARGAGTTAGGRKKLHQFGGIRPTFLTSGITSAPGCPVNAALTALAIPSAA